MFKKVLYRYGLCNERSRQRSHWKEPAEEHSCYYHQVDSAMLILELPPLEWLRNISIISLILLLPGIVWLLTLIWLVYMMVQYFILVCNPNLNQNLNFNNNNDNVLVDIPAENNDQPVDEPPEIEQNEEPHLSAAQQQMEAQGWNTNGNYL
jgi:hypothetical protein